MTLLGNWVRFVANIFMTNDNFYGIFLVGAKILFPVRVKKLHVK